MASAASLPLLFLLLSLPILPIFVAAQTNVTVGLSLSAADNSSSWRSPSGEFAFGFRRLANTNLYLLAIWFDKIPEKTIVWYANGDKPAPEGSKVELTSDQLVLNDPQGQLIWKQPDTPPNAAISYGAMLDTGNFVLLPGPNSGYAWESFNSPTDTILPKQTLQLGGQLSSRQTGTNYSRGKFQLRFLDDGDLVLNTVGLPTSFSYGDYYVSGTKAQDPTDSGYQLVFDESGYMYIQRRNGQKFDFNKTTIPQISNYYHRATLDYDGVFVQYYRRRTGDASWQQLWIIPDNICLGTLDDLGSGVCGYNSYCTLKDGRPSCNCPSRYSLVDPNNQLSDCKPDFLPDCIGEDGSGNKEEEFQFQVLDRIDWPTSDYGRLEPMNQSECQNSCLHDCHCAVAIHRGQTCWKKKLPLSNGRFKEDDTAKALVKIRVTAPPPPPSSRNNTHCPIIPDAKGKYENKTLILTGSLLLGSSVFVNFLFGAAICLVLFTNRKKLKTVEPEISVLETNLRSFTYKELEEATQGFSEEIGRGAFGIVYKGVLGTSSRSLVAVKKLDKVVPKGEEEFKTEVRIIGRTHHKNLVQLLGYCMEGQQRLLVYEFMSNGTLASFLFGIMRPDWNQRVQIAFGIARGLVYLHEECSTQIIHCDIKPQNILLDDHFTARISDFGLAKLLMTNQSRTLASIRGTKGYVAPEWFRNMPITVKVDVYSFGVMMLEIICCRKSVEQETVADHRVILTDWAYDCYQQGRLDELVENDMDAMNDICRLERLVRIAIWCIQEEPSLKPTMKNVIQMLEGIVEVPLPPCPYPYSSVN
ncbi:PREDICTED: G-type lectin S-receptor-like serine/threonine-protein kinase LECRK3 [Nelumbo nucifera]|uniref:Receptor-like serine/threonine-protein kinase n=2 Tax=Nelumbo nucifera TaxID=4432 RepID=A0A1U7ZYN8_NELNU|nr:PREDICTED: G-type lectin S-receptor-like serine/threonine-protein kinase LECRK3 [Nelumbo nucifera]DAD42217.1 TPA_asm: hypothetical protein HUJ06_000447 [Nelumbo nucifera]